MESLPQYMSRFLPVCQPLSEISLWVFLIAFAWSIAWKGAALWRAARNNQLYWFVGLLLVNTVGILEIIYIYVFTKKQPEKNSGSGSGISFSIK